MKTFDGNIKIGLCVFKSYLIVKLTHPLIILSVLILVSQSQRWNSIVLVLVCEYYVIILLNDLMSAHVYNFIIFNVVITSIIIILMYRCPDDHYFLMSNILIWLWK